MKQYKAVAVLQDGEKQYILNNNVKNIYDAKYFNSIEELKKAIERDKKIDNRIVDILIYEREITDFKKVII